MTIVLDLQPDIEIQLHTLAEAQGIAPSEYASALFRHAVIERIGLRERNAATLAVLDAFKSEDTDEQRETWEALQSGITATRQSTRKVTS